AAVLSATRRRADRGADGLRSEVCADPQRGGGHREPAGEAGRHADHHGRGDGRGVAGAVGVAFARPASDPGPYVARNATCGSIDITRRAGTKHDSSATARSTPATAANVTGSLAAMPKSSDSMSRDSARAPAKPSSSPTATSAIPWRITI